MILELTIKNYALIDSLQLEFNKGLNVLTGETGAGKSIIIDAIGLLLGEKINGNVLKDPSQKCTITGVFDIKKNKPAKNFLNSLSLLNEDTSVILRREIDQQNKSRAFINDQPVSLTALAQAGDCLIDIHGQHEHQLLLKSPEQRDLLDRYAGNEPLRQETEKLYQQWQNLRTELESSQISEQEKNQRLDLYKFQVNEIESAKLVPGEETTIEEQIPKLKNADKLRTLSEELYQHFYEVGGSVLERLKKSQLLVQSIEDLGIHLQQSQTLIEECRVRAEEIADVASSFKDTLDADPQKLDDLIARQDLTEKLKKKYGADIPAILAFKEKAKEELSRLESHTQTIQELNERFKKAYQTLLQCAKKLSTARKKAAEQLTSAVQKELKDLGFPKAQFLVQLLPEKDAEGNELPTSAGLERIEFLFSANPGIPPKPLKQVASGGELSRIMLALKEILAESDVIPTLIFDEIDSGIGGSMGNVIGGKLKQLSRFHQIILITHLPQIAAFADQHVSVKKEIFGKKTQLAIGTIHQEERIREIARMLGGAGSLDQTLSDISIQHASELLKQTK